MGLAVAWWSPSPAGAQVDVAIDSVSVSPAAMSPGKTATVPAVVRRPALPNLPQALKGLGGLELEFGLTAEAKPLAGRNLGLGPDQSQTVEFAWVARAGKHVFRVRVARVTLKGQQLQDLKPENDERLSGQFSVQKADPPATAGPGPTLKPPAPAVDAPVTGPSAPANSRRIASPAAGRAGVDPPPGGGRLSSAPPGCASTVSWPARARRAARSGSRGICPRIRRFRMSGSS